MTTMDLFDTAIQAHVGWKGKLSAYVRRPDRSLKAADVARDCDCALGKWIHGEARKYASLPEYQTLLKQHAIFHREAADIVRRADAGDAVTGEVVLGGNSSFSRASQEVVSAINEMKRKV
jgi:methyl-accepting chemotaxis protein